MRAKFVFSGWRKLWSWCGYKYSEKTRCLFARFDSDTTIQGVIDALTADFRKNVGWAGFSDNDVKSALLLCLRQPERVGYVVGDKWDRSETWGGLVVAQIERP